jgi:hypothetical protein
MIAIGDNNFMAARIPVIACYGTIVGVAFFAHNLTEATGFKPSEKLVSMQSHFRANPSLLGQRGYWLPLYTLRIANGGEGSDKRDDAEYRSENERAQFLGGFHHRGYDSNGARPCFDLT